MKVVPVTRCGH